MHNLHFFSIFDGSVPRYGGDISSCSWIQYVQGGTRTYAFSYDPLSRLSGANQYGGSSLENRFTERGISYDRNGNITAITRHNNSASGTAKTFSYSGNRRVSNSYDANGNVTYDSESGVIASYNLINLPASLISSDYNIYYDYLANGTKLRTQQEELWTGYTYAGPFRYNDNDGSLSLESVAFGEGRFVRTGTGARNFATRYFIKDHLGSVRVVADDNGTALERDDYLPYGERANDPALTRNGNNFLYGGKELQDRDDIDWYDSGARFQTTSGIFTSIDPYAEKYYPISPYVYCGGNPVRFIDPDGRWNWDTNGNLVAQKGDNSYTMAKFLGTSQSNAMQMLNRGGVTTNAKGLLNLKEGQSFAKGSLWVGTKSASGTVVNNTTEAKNHYFNGNVTAADVGDNSTRQLLTSDKFQAKHNRITSQKVASKGYFSVDMTNKDGSFHIGNTGVDYIVSSNGQSSSVTYTLFTNTDKNSSNLTDGFWDPNFAAEKTLGKIGIGKYKPDEIIMDP
jgi:RHS repeat-associated protein